MIRPLPLILASASPRRQELLRELVSDFTTVVSGVEEAGSSFYPEWEFTPLALPEPFELPLESDPRLWAWRKGMDALAIAPSMQPSPVLALAADTIVVSRGGILGKPADGADSQRMLELLRGQNHFVATGFVLLSSGPSGTKTLHVQAVVAMVTMRDYTQDELLAYVETGEPNDKAGAYAIQGLGGSLVAGVEGCVTTVIGLPLCAVRSALLSAGVRMLARPARGYCVLCPRLLDGDVIRST